jgi:hypothetical protein
VGFGRRGCNISIRDGYAIFCKNTLGLVFVQFHLESPLQSPDSLTSHTKPESQANYTMISKAYLFVEQLMTRQMANRKENPG